MFLHKSKTEFLGREFVWLWTALAFQAGFANAGGFLACARYISHMTGFGTQVGIAISQLDYSMALEMFSAPLSFLAGAMTSAIAVDRRMAAGRRPNYLQVMAGLVFLFLLVSLGGVYGMFGAFGEPLILARDFTLMSLLCFACGMQNACFASLTRGQIRTTHLTGILTDIGITFVKVATIKTGRELILLKRTNFIRLLTFFSFSSGSAVSAVVFSKIQYSGFFLLVLSSGTMLLTMIYKQRKVDRRRDAFLRALESAPRIPKETAKASDKRQRLASPQK